MATVAAPPIPTPADQLPKLKAPPGFKVEVYQSGVLDARGLRRGGREQMPRLAGQHEEYTIQALQDYRAGVRVGTQAVMAEAVRGGWTMPP